MPLTVWNILQEFLATISHGHGCKWLGVACYALLAPNDTIKPPYAAACWCDLPGLQYKFFFSVKACQILG